MQVVPDEDQLLPRALKLAAQAARKSETVNQTIKEMQHDGAGFSVSGALRYEMDIAAKAYAVMGQQGAGTQQRLSKEFKNRSKL
jgi:enoyl-CoA hydratase/carnithine racemase